MSTNPTPKPPAGYQLENELKNVPNFEKSLVPSTSIDLQSSDPNLAGEVVPWEPHTIKIFGEDQGTQNTVTHEMTHVFQDSRNLDVLAGSLKNIVTGKTNKNYDYGGVDGLLQAQQNHKTINDFGPEQLASMTADYQEQAKAAIDKGDAATLDKLNEAYSPYIRQEASLPKRGESMTTMTQKDLTPPEPGLPPAEETGILAENKLMGSDEKVLKNPPKLPSSNLITQSYQGKAVPGIVEPGNLDITKRPNIDNHDGTHSSTFSISFGTDKGEVLVPGVGDGKNYPLRKLTPKEALDQYHKTGGNFGTFKTIKDANTYAEKLHEDQATYGNRPKLPKGYHLETPQ